ncbi:MAG: hypothetical protein V1754_13090 [Pseudomonadota bacterium]
MNHMNDDEKEDIEILEPEIPEQDHEPLEFDERELCPDGNCIGVIGFDGKCKVCGALRQEPEPEIPFPETFEEKLESAVAPFDNPDDDPLDFQDRVLCSDGACIGVIGPDGLCKECGKHQGSEQDN